MVTIVRREVRKRGLIGQLFKWTFVLFNVLMAWRLISYWVNIGGMVSGTANEFEEAGAVIGGTIGTGMLVFFWLAGAVILGLITIMTRGKTTIIEERQE